MHFRGLRRLLLRQSCGSNKALTAPLFAEVPRFYDASDYEISDRAWRHLTDAERRAFATRGIRARSPLLDNPLLA